MNNLGRLILYVLLAHPLFLYGQETEAPIPAMSLDPMQDRVDWVPALLNASSNTLFNAVAFQGGVFSWRLRGGQVAALNVDGVDWNPGLHNWNPAHLFMGFQNAFSVEDIAFNDVFSQRSYLPYATVFYKSSKPTDPAKSWKLSTTFSNRLLGNTMGLYYNSDRLHLWRYRVGGFMQWMPASNTVIGFKESAGLLWSAVRDLKKQKQLGFSFIWNYHHQSKASTSVKEMYLLAGQSNYQSNWGWYHQQMYFPSTSQNNTALFSFQFKKQHSLNKSLEWNNAFAMGFQSQSSLEWTNTSDPRPDYYRYLPSYLTDSLLRNALSNWLSGHPAQLQIQFDEMEKINKASGRSFYMVNQRMNQLLIWHGHLQLANHLSNWRYQLGIDYSLEQTHRFDVVKDLLGGSYYMNYNNWMNEDGSNLSFQNDILHPDRKIAKGERWGADYALSLVQIRPWMQWFKESARFETYLGMGLGLQGFQRSGYNANGLYGSQSKGKSTFQSFPSWDFKGQWLYKYSGRWYARSIAYIRQIAPTSANYFLQPDMSSLPSPYVHGEQELGLAFGMIYRAPLWKWASTVYWKTNRGASAQKMFYHDAFSSFVYGVAGDIKTISKGVELSIETTCFSKVVMSWVGNLQQNVFDQNLPYQLLYLNDLHVLTSGTLYVQGLPSSNTPSWIQAFSFTYHPANSWSLGVNYMYACQRPVSMDIFRRSEWVKTKLDDQSWQRIKELPLLPNEGLLNCFLSKSIQQKTRRGWLKWYTSFSVHNALNAWIPVFAYEQTRFDYLHFNNQKYAIKYLMDQGATYTLRIQLQIQ